MKNKNGRNMGRAIPFREVVSRIGENDLVLDVGGAVLPFARADWMIDVVPFEDISIRGTKEGTPPRYSKDTYVQWDVCDRKPWPFKDKQFDFVLCSHLLEDIRDPIWVCSELIRVSKAGYIEVPSRLYETTMHGEIPGQAGNTHHRWIIDVDEKGGLRFAFKHGQVHSKYINKNKVPRVYDAPQNYLQYFWKDKFDYYEHHLLNGPEVIEYHLGRKITRAEKWKIYRQTDPRNIFIRWAAYFKNLWTGNM